MWFEITLILLVVALLVGSRVVPAQYRYLSLRKRRAIRIALNEFTHTRDTNPERANCRLYHTDSKRSIVGAEKVSGTVCLNFDSICQSSKL